MASSFLRSLSQRFKSKGCRRTQQQPNALESKQSEPALRYSCQCHIQLLDGTDLNMAIDKAAMGQELRDRVFAYLDLEECDYFGIQFTDQFHVQHWLDPVKSVRKQIPIGPPYAVRFRVKFFSNEPANLRDELTRYLFFLQLRQYIQSGSLDCSKEMAIELVALAMQAEFGDFNPREHSTNFISEFRFYPGQDELMEVAVLRKWADPQLAGLSPSQAEMFFLEKCRQLPFYGVDLHQVLGRDGCQYRLGLSPQGMLVFDGRQKIGLFLWERIQQLDFRGRRISLVVEEELPAHQKGGQLVQLHTFIFQLASSRAAKHLWKCAIEFHTFYRLKFPRVQDKQRRVLPPLFRLGSTFRYRGRTEYETMLLRQGQQAAAGGATPRRCSSAERPIFRRPSSNKRHAAEKNGTGVGGAPHSSADHPNQLSSIQNGPSNRGIQNGAIWTDGQVRKRMPIPVSTEL